MVRTDENGSIIWEKTFGESVSESGIHCILEDNGRCVILAEKQSSSQGYWLIKINKGIYQHEPQMSY